MTKRLLLALALLLVLLPAASTLVPLAQAVETEQTEDTGDPAEKTGFIEIHTVQDLQAITENPAGSYILMEDLDMTGVAWKSLDFCGIFDGNGHAILNLTLSQPGDEKPFSYDGNAKSYETTYYGLFSTLKNAQVTGLKLINVRALVETDEPCFLAGLAGYAENSTISDCMITGNLELRAHNQIFGVGGVVGYGGGTVERCVVDVTLICTDTDATTRDEQFMGGVFATGFMNVLDCEVVIDGYCSEHGYVHNGGITGLFMQYPMGEGFHGSISNNTVTGKITFFEDNYDRRAYCSAFAGEILAASYSVTYNTDNFMRDEKWTFDEELRPEMCGEPAYLETVVAAGCDTYGYTSYECDNCGYTYTDHYTHFQHTVTTWTVTEEPTTQKEGLSVAYCDLCGKAFERTEPMLEPEPTEATQEMEVVPKNTEPVPQREWSIQQNSGSVVLYSTIGSLLLAVAAAFILREKKKPAIQEDTAGEDELPEPMESVFWQEGEQEHLEMEGIEAEEVVYEEESLPDTYEEAFEIPLVTIPYEEPYEEHVSVSHTKRKPGKYLRKGRDHK